MKLHCLILSLAFCLVSCDKRESEFIVATESGILTESVGLPTIGGVFAPILHAGSEVPLIRSQVFSTAADNPTSIEIILYAGNARLVKDCRLLGVFRVADIRESPRGERDIQVTFSVARDGFFSLTARDKSTDQEQEITVLDRNSENQPNRVPVTD